MQSTIITCLLIYTFIFLNTRWCSCNGNSPNNSTSSCKPSERAALLNFMRNLTYFNKELSSSWKGEECCEWRQVLCDNTTGHILELDLAGYFLKVEKLESLVFLLDLKKLESLDLSHNNYGYNSIPSFIGSMKQLRYLDLSSASLGGLVTRELGNLTNLRFLKLSNNTLIGEIPASLGKLSNLKELYLSENNLTSIASSLRFPLNLESLILSYNQLNGKISTSIGNLPKLQFLYLSSNPLVGTVLCEPHFANLSSLTYLDMSDTMLTLNLSSDWVPPFQLQYFSAANCKFNGNLPPWLQTQKNLSFLELFDANISGLMPSWFHTMQQLDYVDLSNNNLSGSPIFPVHFSIITLSNNSLSGLLFSNCSKTEKYGRAQGIYLDNNFIVGALPERLVKIMPNIETLSLANNQIEGSIPNSLCQSTSLITLDMRDNSLTGVIPNCWGMGKYVPYLESLYLSNNQINGPIPNSFCQLTSLNQLDIHNNSLSGVIPNCWANISTLNFVRLSYNKLKGRIPCFISKYSFADKFYLHLNDNILSGAIPLCLSDLPNLKVLDIGGNQLSGKMLKWFTAEKFKELQILRLRGNKLFGTIPKQICSLPKLQLMDLGHNRFTGSIPSCLSNLTAMISPDISGDMDTSDVREVYQGIERAYTSTLPYLVDIDLSCNSLVGSIPDDMTKISSLLSLNLSYNMLSGTIPTNNWGFEVIDLTRLVKE